MIYCVVPADLAEELFDRLTAYYAGDPNVAVIVDRRRGERRSRASASDAARRQLRDRRRRGAGMLLPQLDPLA